MDFTLLRKLLDEQKEAIRRREMPFDEGAIYQAAIHPSSFQVMQRKGFTAQEPKDDVELAFEVAKEALKRGFANPALLTHEGEVVEIVFEEPGPNSAVWIATRSGNKRVERKALTRIQRGDFVFFPRNGTDSAYREIIAIFPEFDRLFHTGRYQGDIEQLKLSHFANMRGDDSPMLVSRAQKRDDEKPRGGFEVGDHFVYRGRDRSFTLEGVSEISGFNTRGVATFVGSQRLENIRPVPKPGDSVLYRGELGSFMTELVEFDLSVSKWEAKPKIKYGDDVIEVERKAIVLLDSPKPPQEDAGGADTTTQS